MSRRGHEVQSDYTSDFRPVCTLKYLPFFFNEMLLQFLSSYSSVRARVRINTNAGTASE